ncbi:DNA mismatch repair protein MutS [candidate division WOR-3 bacterium 4484_100]|uniref:DNA mismatch repair protein MutS n=1 Tax=candidate division WOR-3 bacterium 4484_100 TaxID=1936077 RepID=A0A1V4QEM0_UNCW3|nr:MAG: DNA mismatch repair protein MutS [candidate division WOR-3 bacterium 4484_100]
MHLTPLLEQYQKIKNQYKDTLLLFRVGDFYEFYYDDARIASNYLGIVLTAKTISRGIKVPLAGIPIKASESYISKLVKAGFKVAICEQLEPATKGKKLVARDVVEVITPGTILRPSLLEEKRSQFIASCVPDKKRFGIAFCDLTSGEFSCGEIEPEQLKEAILRKETREIIAPEGIQLEIDIPRTYLDGYHFIYEIAYKKLTDHFKVINLNGFGIENKKLGIAAAGALLYYLSENQKTTLTHINRISLFEPRDVLYIDATTRKNLELVENIHGGTERTLFSIMDACLTAFGKRLLRRELLEPLTKPELIEARLQAVDELKVKEFLREELRGILENLHDVERITARLACKRILPREMISLKESLKTYPHIKGLIENCECELLQMIHKKIDNFDDLVKRIEEVIVPEPPATLDQGGIIKKGYSPELDKLLEIARGGKNWLLKFEKQQKERTGIASLKVSYNSVFGYYIEVTKPNLHLVPDDYIRKQTLSNAERFYTTELKEFEQKILTAEEDIKKIEYEIYVGLRDEISEKSNEILDTTKALAQLDMLQAFAHNAVINNYSRPEVNTNNHISIIEGRHPVVEKLLEKGSFVPNDTELNRNKNQILIITGPNMAGKSTYLRQVALIVIMAQVGSFVPAREARIGIVDKIFSRIGASDDISRGVSTFLAEMAETANILNNVTEKSLVILDEVGRGTSTYDGLALAWSVVEYLHQHKKPRTLFATHFHELTRIEDFLDGVKNYNFLVKEWSDEIIFLRKISPGPSDQSYGIHVARLAGLPDSVIKRAKQVLRDFEEGEVFSVRKLKRAKLSQQDLFVDK